MACDAAYMAQAAPYMQNMYAAAWPYEPRFYPTSLPHPDTFAHPVRQARVYF